jgi:DNA modification methylase
VTTLLDDGDVELRVGDLLDLLPALEAGSVDAVVTSPPYADARPDVPAPSPIMFPGWAHGWLALLARILTPKGSIMLNLGRRFANGEESTYIWETVALARTCGLRLVDTLVWHKVNGGGGRRTAHLIDRHEYVLWLAPDPAACYRGFDEARQPYSPATLERYQRRWRTSPVGKGGDHPAPVDEGRRPHPLGAKAGSVFTTSVGAEKGIEHPSPMAVELCRHLIRLSCPPGGRVLDPFAGSGTTGVEARVLGRRALLFEIDPVFADEAARRLAPQRLAIA